MMSNYRLRSLLVALLPIVALAGCNSNNGAGGGVPTTGAAGGSGVATVNIGYTPTIVLPQPLVGLVDGEYHKRMPGITFNGKLYAAGSGVVEALRAGIVDIGCSGPYPALQAYAKAKDIVMLAGAATGGTAIMVSKNSPYHSVSDLKGKAIGVNQPGSTVDAMVRNALIDAGLRPDKDVPIILVEPAAQADALMRGEVAAVAAPAPWPSQVAIKGNARPLLDWRKILDNGEYLSGSVFTTARFAKAHPEFIKKFVAAHRALTDELNGNRAKSDAKVLAAWSKVTTKTLSPEVAKASFATIKYTSAADERGLQRFADLANRVGILRQKPDLTGFVWKP